MASTAIEDPEFMEEHLDSDDILAQKVDRLADMVRNSRHFVAFTGAGISTSAGIPDFRGPTGKWTREAKGLKPLKGVSVVDAYPTSAHMSLLELYRRGVLKYLISQNCDGLHRRSGFPASGISELHGNCWVEICEDCGQQFFRDFKCLRRTKEGGAKNPADHFTGRFCHCSGRLLNSTIDFGQSLPEMPLNRAKQHSRQADLHLALGSSLRVRPACCQPEVTAARGGNLVICNLQKTPLTDIAALHIYARTDTVMEMLMERLSIPIPQFRLLRRIVMGRTESPGQVYLKAVDAHDPTVKVEHVAAIDWQGSGTPQAVMQDPMAAVSLQQGLLHRSRSYEVAPKLYFTGHYHEPPLELNADLTNVAAVDIRLSFDPYSGVWQVLSQHDIPDGRLEAPPDAVEARIPDYGQSNREYCIKMVMKSRECDEKSAGEIIRMRFEDSRRDVLAAANSSLRKRSPARAK